MTPQETNLAWCALRAAGLATLQFQIVCEVLAAQAHGETIRRPELVRAICWTQPKTVHRAIVTLTERKFLLQEGGKVSKHEDPREYNPELLINLDVNTWETLKGESVFAEGSRHRRGLRKMLATESSMATAEFVFSRPRTRPQKQAAPVDSGKSEADDRAAGGRPELPESTGVPAFVDVYLGKK